MVFVQWYITISSCSTNFSFVLTWINLIQALTINYIRCKEWDDILYQLPNFNGAAVEVCEWIVISSHSLQSIELLIYHFIINLSHISKRGPRLPNKQTFSRRYTVHWFSLNLLSGYVKLNAPVIATCEDYTIRCPKMTTLFIVLVAT